MTTRRLGRELLPVLFAAGLAVGFWNDERALRGLVREERRWEPQMESGEREREYEQWRKAVERSLDWAD